MSIMRPKFPNAPDVLGLVSTRMYNPGLEGWGGGGVELRISSDGIEGLFWFEIFDSGIFLVGKFGKYFFCVA